MVKSSNGELVIPAAMKLLSLLRTLGPGLLFAGAAIGVSHLVQSTRAGAGYGFGLLWAVVIVHLFKYPFFRYGPRYAMATGQSLIEGYAQLGRWVLGLYTVLTFLTMFTIQAAVTIVTAGLAISLFGVSDDVGLWSIIVTLSCCAILFWGRYHLLDRIIKGIILILTLSTIAVVVLAFDSNQQSIRWTQVLPQGRVHIAFLIALMGWMPAPLDISAWYSIWTVEKQKDLADYQEQQSELDFNVGYLATIFLAFCFVALGALVMYRSGVPLEGTAGAFAQQLISLYTDQLGARYAILIKIAAFATMFSTTITTLDASPRAMAQSVRLLAKTQKENYRLWLIVLSLGTIFILCFMVSSMMTMVKLATIISFLTAPFYAVANYVLISSKHTPKAWRPSMGMKIWSYLGFGFLIGFSIWYLWVYFY